MSRSIQQVTCAKAASDADAREGIPPVRNKAAEPRAWTPPPPSYRRRGDRRKAHRLTYTPPKGTP